MGGCGRSLSSIEDGGGERSVVLPERDEAKREDSGRLEQREPAPEFSFLERRKPPPERKPLPVYPSDGYSAIVTHIVDGDTLYLVMKPGGWASRIRLKGLNAPECKKKKEGATSFYVCSADDEYYGLKAYEALKSLVSGAAHKVRISCRQKNGACEKDSYNRYLAYLQLADQRDLGEVLLRAGVAWTFTRYANSKLAAYCRAEAEAIRQRRGMWSQGRDFVIQRMSHNTRSWYASRTGRGHDAICSKALGRSFAKLAGE